MANKTDVSTATLDKKMFQNLIIKNVKSVVVGEKYIVGKDVVVVFKRWEEQEDGVIGMGCANPLSKDIIFNDMWFDELAKYAGKKEFEAIATNLWGVVLHEIAHLWKGALYHGNGWDNWKEDKGEYIKGKNTASHNKYFHKYLSKLETKYNYLFNGFYDSLLNIFFSEAELK